MPQKCFVVIALVTGSAAAVQPRAPLPPQLFRDSSQNESQPMLTTTDCKTDSQLATSPDHVTIDSGVIRGARLGSTYAFKGIPYAAPPIGTLRWQPPRPVRCWSGVRTASQFGSVCPQVGALPGTTTTWLGSEDCLTLNVWTPANRGRRERMPVLVFLHGGGNTRGAGSMAPTSTIPILGWNIQDGQYLATLERVVVVTVNFRLGFLGFLAHPALSQESGVHGSGNYALMDQIAALEWVRRNIARFGGDPERVLLFGHSAGGRDGCGIMAIETASHLFSRIAHLSGHCENLPTLEAAEAIGESWAVKVGCGSVPDPVACLRAIPTEQVVLTPLDQPLRLFSADFFRLGPIVDKVLLDEQPIARFNSSRYRGVPLLSNSTANEVAFALFQQMYRGSIETTADYVSAVRSLAPSGLVPDILARYPVDQYPTPRAALTELLSDANSFCPSRRKALALAESGHPVWRSIWMHTASNGPARTFGPAHVTDLPYWFNNLSVMPNFTPTLSEVKLAETMARYLVTFARTGNPNHRGAPTWPQYEPTKKLELRLDDTMSIRSRFRDTLCEFWDSRMPPAGLDLERAASIEALAVVRRHALHGSKIGSKWRPVSESPEP